MGVEDMDLDDDDPSEAWVSQSIGGSGFLHHTPNGPLGSERPKSTSPLSSITNGSAFSTLSNTPISRSQGIEIKRQRNKTTASSPLTSSVQENFRGFTYSGGESLIPPMLSALGKTEKHDEAVDDEEFLEITTDDEAEDTETSAGRYANARRKNGFRDDDDMS